jgi:hypothetical protein
MENDRTAYDSLLDLNGYRQSRARRVHLRLAVTFASPARPSWRQPRPRHPANIARDDASRVPTPYVQTDPLLPACRTRDI